MIAIPRHSKGTKEELLNYYPTFYRSIIEFVAIQEAAAMILDKLFDAFQQCADDSNLITARENIIAFYENIIGIKYASLRTLEERRRFVLVYCNMFGKVSATKIKNALRFYTGSDIDVKFNNKDSDGNYILEIIVKKGNNSEIIDLENINALLKKIIPAHLQYKSIINYNESKSLYTAVSVNTAMTYTITLDINKHYTINDRLNTAASVNTATITTIS